MAITEESRHEMYAKLEDLMGHDGATTLMEHLPPVGWADVATKRDLELQDLKFEAMLHRELNRVQMNLFFGLATLNLTTASLVVAAAHVLS